MSRSKIVINAIPLLSKLTGIGRYAQEISKRIRVLAPDNEFVYYYGYFSKKLFMTDSASSGGLTRRIKDVLTRNHAVKKITRESLFFLAGFSLTKFDLYWEPNIVPLAHIRSRYTVTTVHDFSFQHYPECLPRERREYLKKHFWRKSVKSDLIITGSHYVKEEIVKYLDYDEARIKVIHHGVDHDVFKTHDPAEMHEFSGTHGLPENFILFVGSIEPRKNLKNALLAYNALPGSFKRACKFVLAGFSGWKNDEIMKIIRKEKDNIVYMGYLPNRDLALLYNLADAVIYPTLYEGFGLPPLEAMACGTPVIVSDTSSLPEVCRDAAYYIDPLSVESIADGIVKVVSDSEQRNSLTQKGLERARSFSWDVSARQHLSLFHEVLRS